jgi:glycosyltransferase involved in cell wall biosynthesis
MSAWKRRRNGLIMGERYELEAGCLCDPHKEETMHAMPTRDAPKTGGNRRPDPRVTFSPRRGVPRVNQEDDGMPEKNDSPRGVPAATLTVVIPYYNEAGFIGETLRSLLAQSRPPDQIILVDNASADGSEAVCRAVLAGTPHPAVLFLREERPGKAHALETGCGRAAGAFIALCDADVAYPPHYLGLALDLFAAAPKDTVAVMAQVVEKNPAACAETRGKLRRTVWWSRLLPGKCFTGGAGQIFRAEALRRAGGFSAARWNYVLLDHEIMNRMRRQGRSLYHADLWLLHSDRRKDRGGVRWGLLDRILYRYTPGFLGDWFFYRWLGPRFARRRMTQLNLRVQPWAETSGPGADPQGFRMPGVPNRRWRVSDRKQVWKAAAQPAQKAAQAPAQRAGSAHA